MRTWLFGILYRKIAEARREAQKDLRHDPIDELMEERFDSAGAWARPPQAIDAALQGAEVRERIEGCMEPLPLRQRMAFLLRDVEGLSSREISWSFDTCCNNSPLARTHLRGGMK